MSKSIYVALKNRYPGGRVQMSEGSIDAYSASGEHCVAVRKNGNGDWVDQSADMLARDKLDLAPIPKECRRNKLDKDGSVKRAEEYSERKAKAEKLAAKHGGRVPSIAELMGKRPSDSEVAAYKLPAEGSAE